MYRLIMIKYMISLVIISFVSLFFSCIKDSKKDNNWTIYGAKQTGLENLDYNFDKLLINDSVLYLLGSSSGNDLSKTKSIVYKSINYGANWEEEYKNWGNITNGYFVLDKFYLFKEIYTDNSLGNTLLSLVDKDSVILDFKINSFLKGVFINNYGEGVIVVNNSFQAKDNAVLWTTNNFKTYDSIPFNKPVKKSYFYNGKVYLLTQEFSKQDYKIQEQNNLFILDKNGKKNCLKMKNNVEDFVVDKEGITFLIKQKDTAFVEFLLNDGQYNKVKLSNEKNLNLKRIHKYKDFIAILTSKVDEYLLGGFGGTKYQLYFSYDGGKTYSKEEIPINDFVGDISFFKDEKVFIYSGLGRVSICNLKE